MTGPEPLALPDLDDILAAHQGIAGSKAGVIVSGGNLDLDGPPFVG